MLLAMMLLAMLAAMLVASLVAELAGTCDKDPAGGIVRQKEYSEAQLNSHRGAAGRAYKAGRVP